MRAGQIHARERFNRRFSHGRARSAGRFVVGGAPRGGCLARGRTRFGVGGAPRGGRCARGGVRFGDQHGQAAVEVVALVPAVVAVGLVLLQLLAVGYASVLAGSAAEAGALALAAGSDARAGVKEALPGWSRAKADISVDGGQVEVRLRPPSPLESLAERLEVEARAAVEAP